MMMIITIIIIIIIIINTSLSSLYLQQVTRRSKMKYTNLAQNTRPNPLTLLPTKHNALPATCAGYIKVSLWRVLPSYVLFCSIFWMEWKRREGLDWTLQQGFSSGGPLTQSSDFAMNRLCSNSGPLRAHPTSPPPHPLTLPRIKPSSDGLLCFWQ